MNPADILKYGQRTMHGALDAVPMDQWEVAGVCGVWSVKDIVAHLTSYELWLVETFNNILHQSGQPLLEQVGKLGFDGFNDEQVSSRKPLSAQAVLTEFDRAYEEVTRLTKDVPAALWSQNGTLPWYGAEYSLDDYIVYSFYGHKREHSAQVNVFKDSLKNP